jgi:hypothetical protein
MKLLFLIIPFRYLEWERLKWLHPQAWNKLYFMCKLAKNTTKWPGKIFRLWKRYSTLEKVCTSLFCSTRDFFQMSRRICIKKNDSISLHEGIYDRNVKNTLDFWVFLTYISEYQNKQLVSIMYVMFILCDPANQFLLIGFSWNFAWSYPIKIDM